MNLREAPRFFVEIFADFFLQFQVVSEFSNIILKLQQEEGIILR